MGAFELRISFLHAELSAQDAVAAADRRLWDARAPRTLLQVMAAADVTSTCPTGPDGEPLTSQGRLAIREGWGPKTAVLLGILLS